MSLLVKGVKVEVPGLLTRTWDEVGVPRLKLGEDARPRGDGAWVRQIILHTTKGIPGGKDKRPQLIKPGLAPPETDYAGRVARFWSSDPTPSGAHLVLDHDGEVLCLADLVRDRANHAAPCNSGSVGIELYQGRDADLYAGKFDACVRLVDFLTRELGIQRQIPSLYRNRPIKRLAAGGEDVTGVFGHRDVTANRGLGDPGDAVFSALAAAGYDRFDFDAGEDFEEWKKRQRVLGFADRRLDGIAGSATTAALARAGRSRGMWVARPGD